MKATIEFRLPEEREEFDRFLRGPAAFHVLYEIASELRRIRKYEDHPDPIADMAERIESKLHGACAEEGIDPWGE